ncbi:MipA/OmpV family protein [Pelomonas sp. V22]|nr:MipA/OmpV family protein [Pelomonas sp. V22]
MLVLLTGVAQAAEPAPLWEAGLLGFTASQNAYPGASERTQKTLVLPWLIYRGPVLRADRGSVGLRAVKTPEFELDIGFAAALGASSERVKARSGMPDLGLLLEAGPKLRWNLAAEGAQRWRLELPLRAVFDASDSMKMRGWSLEPALQLEQRGETWMSAWSLGPLLGTRHLSDTFYGVAPAYATANRPAYEARAGLIAWRANLSVSRPLAPDWRLFGFARLESLAGAANRASPLVQRQSGASVGIGLSWSGWRSERAAAD